MDMTEHKKMFYTNSFLNVILNSDSDVTMFTSVSHGI